MPPGNHQQSYGNDRRHRSPASTQKALPSAGGDRFRVRGQRHDEMVTRMDKKKLGERQQETGVEQGSLGKTEKIE